MDTYGGILEALQQLAVRLIHQTNLRVQKAYNHAITLLRWGD